MNKKIIFLVLFSIFLASFVIAQNNEKHNVTVYFFYGEECPHCAKARPFLEKLEKRYPELTIEKYEVWHNKENADFFIKLSEACDVQVAGVPTIFIGEETIYGFDSEEGRGREIEEKIRKCISEGCINPVTKIGWKEEKEECPVYKKEKIINLPIIGRVDATKISLPVLTIAFGLVDGFNACAMFVLLILIGLLLRTQSRKRMALIAGIFVFVSGLIYFLFMTVWLNAFILLGKIGFLFVTIGIIAVIIGVINLKDYFFFGKGPSLKISEKAKPGIFKRIRNIVNAESLLIMLIAVIILAVSVNFVEFLCTFGLPMVFTNILASSPISMFTKYLYLSGYILFYMLDDSIVVVIAIITLSSKKLTKNYGRLLKLIAGALMLILGLILIFKPGLLMFG